MQDVEKTEIQSNTSAQRRRRRNRMRPLYGLAVTALVIGVGVSLSMTVFFNIQTIEITGDKPQYTAEDIADASGVHTGDNLMRLNKSDVKQSILERLVLIEDVSIQKKFPDTLVISVTPGQAAFNVTDSSGTLLVSATGKILKSSPDADASLPTITGFEIAQREPGQQLASKDSQKDKIFETLSERISSGLDFPITAIDLTDKYDIQITFDGRVLFTPGNWSDMDYKITLAETVLAQLGEDKVGYLDMIGDHQCSFRDKDAVEQQTTAPLVTTVTDEYGNVITQSGGEIGADAETTTTESVGWQ